MQTLVEILFRAVILTMLSTKPGRHLGIATLVAFAAGCAASLTTNDVVAARWTFLGAFLTYLGFASVYAALPKEALSATSDHVQEPDPPCESVENARILGNLAGILGSLAGLIICSFAIRAMQAGLELVGLTEGVALWFELGGLFRCISGADVCRSEAMEP